MKIEIISALIGAGGTIITGLISSPILSKIFVAKNQNKIYLKESTFQKSIIGEWSGKNIQDYGISGEKMEVQLMAEFNVKRKKITGTITVIWYEDQNKIQTKLICQGGFISNNHIHILYHSQIEGVQNYGLSFFRINSSGNQIDGAMIGYGHRLEKIIRGEILLTKTN